MFCILVQSVAFLPAETVNVSNVNISIIYAGLGFILPYSFGFTKVQSPVPRLFTDIFAHIELI